MRNIILFLGIFFCCAPASHAKIIYVNQNATGMNNGTSWANAFIELYTALPTAQYGDEIWVAKGTYLPYIPAVATAFNLVSGTKLLGGFVGTETNSAQRDWVAHETILSGLAVPPFKVPNVVYCENTDSTTLLDGFAIRDGLADIFNGASCDVAPNYHYCYGGGVYLYNNNPAVPTFLTARHCRFVDNIARYGGGISVNFGIGSGGLRVEKCRFENNGCNQEGGGIYVFTGQVPQYAFRVDSCIFNGNYGYVSSGISVTNLSDSLDLRITNSLFQDNKATISCASIYIGNGGQHKPLIDNCFFINNKAGSNQFEPGGGAAIGGNNIRINNCFFKGNTAYYGGAANVRYAEISNCIFVRNIATRDGGALRLVEKNYLLNNTFVRNQAYIGGGAISDIGYTWDTIVNCIFIGNHAGQNGDWMASTFGKILVSHSFFDAESCADLGNGINAQYATFTCINNLFLPDPFFRDTANGDYRLTGCSPALNRGDSAWVARFGLLTDLAGIPRILDNLPDIGAYETKAFLPFIQKKDISCFGGQDGMAAAIATGGYSPYDFLWNTGEQDSTLELLSEGAYTVIISDADDCVDTLNVTIAEPALLQAALLVTNASASNISDGAIAVQDIEGGTPPYSFHWNTSDTTMNISGLLPGFYYLTLTDTNDCGAVLTAEVGITSEATEPAASRWRAEIVSNLSLTHSGRVFLMLDCPAPESFRLLLTDAAGRAFNSRNLSVPAGQSRIQLFEPLVSGIYFLYMGDAVGRRTVIKFVKQ